MNMNSLYNENDLNIINKKIKSNVIVLTCFLLVFLLFNTLMIAFSTYETYKLLKLITSICDALLLVVIISLLTINIFPYANIKDHYKNVLFDKGTVVIGTIISINEDCIMLSKNVRVREILVDIESKQRIIYLNSIFEEIPFKENECYEFVLSNNFIKGYLKQNDEPKEG